jgi:hypothetical protein
MSNTFSHILPICAFFTDLIKGQGENTKSTGRKPAKKIKIATGNQSEAMKIWLSTLKPANHSILKFTAG